MTVFSNSSSLKLQKSCVNVFHKENAHQHILATGCFRVANLKAVVSVIAIITDD